MTALERIERIRSAKFLEDIQGNDLYFLIRAFDVMREVAIEESYAYGEMCAGRTESAEVIDKEFEERMKE